MVWIAMDYRFQEPFCERMFGFAQVPGRRERFFKMAARSRVIIFCKRLPSKREMRAHMLAERLPIAFPSIHLGKRVITGSLPCVIPDRLVKGRVSFFITPKMTQDQPQIVPRFTVIRIRIAQGQARDGPEKMRFGIGKLATPQVPKPHRVVAARIVRIAPQRLAPVNIGLPCGVAVLLQVKPGNVEFFIGADFRRKRRFGRRRGKLAFCGLPRLVADDLTACGIGHKKAQIVKRRTLRQRHFPDQ